MGNQNLHLSHMCRFHRQNKWGFYFIEALRLWLSSSCLKHCKPLLLYHHHLLHKQKLGSWFKRDLFPRWRECQKTCLGNILDVILLRVHAPDVLAKKSDLYELLTNAKEGPNISNMQHSIKKFLINPSALDAAFHDLPSSSWLTTSMKYPDFVTCPMCWILWAH